MYCVIFSTRDIPILITHTGTPFDMSVGHKLGHFVVVVSVVQKYTKTRHSGVYGATIGYDVVCKVKNII